MKSVKWKFAAIAALTVATSTTYAHGGALDGVRESWRSVKAQVREMLGMRPAHSAEGCPMMNGGGMMGGSMTGNTPNAQWRGQDAPRPDGERK